jgi:hypothetical protein
VSVIYSGTPGVDVPGAFVPGLALPSLSPSGPVVVPSLKGAAVSITAAGPLAAAARIAAAGPGAAAVTITVP